MRDRNFIIKKDVAVIGAGPTGMFSVFQLGMLGINSVLVDSLPSLGGQCSTLYPEKPIYDIPSHKSISGQELIDNLSLQMSPFAPELVLNSVITNILFNQENNIWNINNADGVNIEAKAIIIAAGGGAFAPNRPPLNNIESFENKSIFYSVHSQNEFKDKTIMIAGGGDSAVDWAISLAEIAEKIYFVHRRDKMRALPENVNKLKKIAESGKIEFCIPYQLHSLSGSNGILESVTLSSINDSILLEKKVDLLLPFFGLSMDLGPISDWGIEIYQKLLKINPATMETSRKGIFAIGDICTYPGKLKLILTGFAEAAVAAHSIYKLIYPNKPLHFEHSTTKGVPAHA